MSQDAKDKYYKASDTGDASEVVEGTLSISQKIGASTSGLLQNAFGPTSAHSGTETLASLNCEASKGASNSVSGQFCEASSSTQSLQVCNTTESARPPFTVESFRSYPRHNISSLEAAQATFDEFAAAPPEAQNPLETLRAASSLDGKRPTACPEIDQVLTKVDRDVREPLGSIKASNFNDEDGAEVVALLSDPMFSVDDNPADLLHYDFDECNDEDGSIARTDHRPQAFAPSEAPIVTSPLDLIPDFDCPSERHALHNLHQDKGYWHAIDRTAVSDIGDVEPWIDMLNRYHDEVWGNMLPLVLRAREEIRVASASKEGALRDRPAVRRLGMLLRHLEIPVS